MREIAPPQTSRRSLPAEEEFIVIDDQGFDEGGIDLRGYWRVITKHRWLIVAVFGLIAAVNAVNALNKIPYYTAETTLLIEQKSPQILDIQHVFTETFGPYDHYETQFRILQSRVLAAEVIRQLGLHKSLFAPQQASPGFVSRLKAIVSDALNKRRGEADAIPATPKPGSVQATGADLLGVKSSLVSAYNGMLTVRPIPKTRLVTIAFTTPDPVLSASIANAHAQAYIRKGIELRTQTSETGQRFLEENLVELRERVEKSEAALNQYRREKGVLSLDDNENIVVDRLTDLNARLTEAEAERISIEAQIKILKSRDYNSLPDVIQSELIQTLKEQQILLQGQRVQLLKKFKSGYSEVAQLEALIEETEQRLEREVQRIVAGIESAYLTAAEKEQNLRAKMEEQKARTFSLKDASVQYGMLAREVDTNRQLYDSVLQRMKEMGIAAELRTSNVSVIDQAETPLGPSGPNTSRSLLMGCFMGLAGGIGLAFVVDYLDNTLKTPEDVEQSLHLPNLGVVPDFVIENGTSGYTSYAAPMRLTQGEEEGGRKRKRVRKKSPGKRVRKKSPEFVYEERSPNTRALQKGREYTDRQKDSAQPSQHKELILSHHPLSLISESYRSLRVAILLSRAEEIPRSLLFTSGAKSEGKTATTVNTAIVFAQMGVRVLIIDSDLRRPRCHSMLNNMQRGPGLADILTGQREPEEVIQRTAVENLFLVGSGAQPPNPAELISSQRMKESLAIFRDRYDYVFIDSPPVMPVSDALLLATLVDGVVIVARGQSTPRHVVKETRERLLYARAKILGVVLNRVNMKSGDFSYYYGRYYSYYHPDEGQKEQDERTVA